MGNREKNLLDAVTAISSIPQTRVVKVSGIYETEPVGYVQQDRFLNMAAAIETGLEPFTLLENLQGIEKALKRERKIRWGPRTIDIDILLYDSVSINCENLETPHPRMFERAFVLIPLRDIYPYKDIKGNNIDNLIEQCGDKNGIRLYKSSSEFFAI